jgi:putative serine protease PepD
MSGQPGNDDAVDVPGKPDVGSEWGGSGPAIPARSSTAAGAAAGRADADSLPGGIAERSTPSQRRSSGHPLGSTSGLPGRDRREARRSRSGALLPGAWAESTGSDPVDHPTGSEDRDDSSDADEHRGLRRSLSSLRRRVRGDGLRGGRLALAVGGLALVCTTLGGVFGGYIALHSQSNTATDPSYSLGTVSPAVTNRPANSIAGIAARVTPSVVMIKVNGGVGTGSGFVIPGNYIVTDNHVVTLDGEFNNASLRVYFSNGNSVRGVVVGRDPYSDIAVIKAEGVSHLPALTLGNSKSVDVGDPVIAVGSPLGLADTVTSGIVSAVNRPVQPGDASATAPQVYFDAIQTDAPINPGNSGGPLVNARGQVIGIDAAIDTLGASPLTGGQGGSIGLGFAIPVNQARRVAVELIRTGRATHAVIGAEIETGWGGNGAKIMPAKAGTTTTIAPGGPAARAGLLPGDVILKFGGQQVSNAATLLDAVRSMAPGAKAHVTFLRAGQVHAVTLRLGSAPS